VQSPPPQAGMVYCATNVANRRLCGAAAKVVPLGPCDALPVYTPMRKIEPMLQVLSGVWALLIGIVLIMLGVTSRVIVDALPEQVGPLALPVLEGVDGRSALQG